ncbi:MAG: mechanosensitive ion channel family protein [Ilumatobacteraceae bacterium]|nr:mechanosensitive ion channel family protein [Ilumatobacteraceae bacterium]
MAKITQASLTESDQVDTFAVVKSFLPSAASDGDLEQTCGSSPSWICETVYEATGDNRVIPGLVEWLLTVAAILFVAWILTRLAKRYFAKMIAHMVAPDRSIAARQLQMVGVKNPEAFIGETPDPGDELDLRRAARVDSISAVVGSTATVTIWVVALLVALGETGVSLAPLIAGAGIAGVALGFGAQSLVKDCLSGFFMLVEDQYGIGDVVDLGEAVGIVEEITLRATVLRGVDGTVWHVPNGEVQRVGNRSQLWSVALIDIDVAYDCDLAVARRVILDSAMTTCASEEWSDVVIDAPELLGVEALGADGITIRLTARTKPGVQWALQRALREHLKIALDDAGIDIPFPQRTVWVRTEDDGPQA